MTVKALTHSFTNTLRFLEEVNAQAAGLSSRTSSFLSKACPMLKARWSVDIGILKPDENNDGGSEWLVKNEKVHITSLVKTTCSFFQHPFLKKSLSIVGVILLLVTVLYVFVVPWAERWGATDVEVVAELPGDMLVTGAVHQVTKAITIQASPDQVWPWLLQLGVDRGGMYSYDVPANLFGLKANSVDSIQINSQDLAAGDFIRFTPKDYFIKPGPGFWVVLLHENYFLVGCFGFEDQKPQPCTSTWQFVLSPWPDGSTRLVLRNRSASTPGFNQEVGRMFNLITFAMERKMLLGIQARAE